MPTIQGNPQLLIESNIQFLGVIIFSLTSNSQHFYGTYYVPGSILHITTVYYYYYCCYYHPHFLDEEIETERSSSTPELAQPGSGRASVQSQYTPPEAVCRAASTLLVTHSLRNPAHSFTHSIRM